MPKRLSNVAKETMIRKEVFRQLESDGWVCWYPQKAPFSYKETDIYGVFDGCAAKGAVEWKLQWTTVPNMAARKKKIVAFLRKFDLEMDYMVYGWNEKKQDFKIFIGR